MRVAAGLLCLALVACGPDVPEGEVVADARSRPTVVEIVAARCGAPSARALGFVVGGGQIVTVAHAAADASAVTVDGAAAVVAVLDAGTDVAVLHVAPRRAVGIGAAEAGATLADPAPGPALVATPEGSRAVTIVRTVTLRGGDIVGDGDHVRPGVELRAVIHDGDSGAPVVDLEGSVVGMVTARSTRAADRAWAVGASAIRPLIDRAASTVADPPTRCAAS